MSKRTCLSVQRNMSLCRKEYVFMSKETCIKNQQGLCLYVKNIRGGNVKNTIPTKKHGEKFAGTVLLSYFCGVLLQ